MEKVIKHLEEVATLFKKSGEIWRATAYLKAITAIKNVDDLEFENGKLKNKIPGVGKSIRETIEEFHATGTSKKYQNLSKDVKSDSTVVYLQEITENWNANFRVPNHTYILENGRLVAYIPEGKKQKIKLKQPLTFDRKGRKFRTVTKRA